MAAQLDSPLQLDQEVEGDLLSSSDFAFRRIGEAVPLKPTDSAFDLKDPPFHPLAVSERSGALFLTHSEGFLVARTKDVIGLAKEIKSNGSGPSIQGSSIVDVQLGRVSIVALSSDSLTLAAVVGRDIRFFIVESLLNKVQEPFFSCSIDRAGVIKDFKWRKGMHKSFIVLSSHSSLYHGSLKDQPKDVMDNVDAVDWSMEGDFVAVARKNTVNILSYDFRKQNSMSLLFKSWPDETGLECNMKVDSINWVGANSIVVGCVRLDEDGNEDGYLVQVITTKEKFAEKSCMPVVYSFPDLFGSIADDILLVGGGPYLLSSYLDRWKIILASNKKAYDNHVVLLQLLVDDKAGEVVSLEFQNDMSPRIDLQENGDDNFILGLGVDKISLYEKVRLQVGSEIEEHSPYCILMCLTCEGKLIMFHAVRISDSLDLPSTTFPRPDDPGSMLGKGKTSSSISLETGLLTTSSKLEDAAQSLVPNVKLSPTTSGVRDGYTGKELSFANLEVSKVSQSSVPLGKEDQVGRSMGQIASKIEFPTVVNFSSSGSGGSSTLVVGNMPAESPAKKINEMSKELGLMNTLGTSVGSQSTRGLQVGVSPSVKSSELSFSKPILSDEHKKTEIQRGEKLHVPSHYSASDASAYHLPSGGPFNFNGSSKEPSPVMYSLNKTAPSEGHSISAARTGTSESVPLVRRSTVMSQEGSLPIRSLFPSMQPAPSSSFKPPQVNCEADMSKEFYNVKHMVKELDTLLSSIEQEGGFMESCAALQRNSSVALNESLEIIFEMSRKCKNIVEEKFMEIQQLQHKMLQISSRQVYMEGIIKQASNDQYWDTWNNQKLSPEFELKRDNILNAYENLTSQLIELERHFDFLEINRFGESGRAVVGRRTSHRSLEPLRQTQSLHSIYNTLSSQLAAAQQLSECLSNQMAVLNLNSPSVRRQNVAKELFESIGLTHGASAVQSPDIKKHVASSEYINRISASPSPSKAIKEVPSGNIRSALKSATPKTARRGRDSIDRSLLSVEPQKTTVKRMLQRRLKNGADTPFRTHTEASSLQIERASVSQPRSHEAPAFSSQKRMNEFRADAHEIEEKTSKQASAPQSNSVFKWATNDSSGSSHSLGLDRSTQPSLSMMPSPSIYSVSQNNTKESSSSPDKTITGVTHFGGQSNSSVKPVSFSRTMLNRQFGTSDPIQTSSSERTTQTGKGQTSQQLNSGATSSLQRSTKNKGQTSGQLSLTAGEEGLTRSLQRSTKDFAGSTVSSLANLGESNISALSPVSAVPSAGNFDKIANRNDATETLSADSKASVPTTPFLFTPSASTTSFTISSSVKSSSPSTLFSTSAVEGTSIDNKTVGEARGAALVFPSLLAASSQSTSSSTGLSSFRSETLPNLASPVQRSPLQPLPTRPIDLSSTTESTVRQAPLSDASLSEINSQHKPAKSELPLKEISDGLVSKAQPSLLSNNIGGMFPATSGSSPQISSGMVPTTTSPTTGKDEGDMTFSQEDEMEEEAPDTASMLNLGALGGFGLGSAPPSSAPKTNPFGGSFVTSTASSMSSLPSHSASPGQLFHPASLNIPSVQPIQQAQAVTSSGQAGGFSGFGQPAQLGAGQKALGSVLGSFGQSRQLGAGVPGFGFAPAGGFGSGGISALGGGGFAGAAQGGGFASAAQGGGFAGAAQGGGFAGAAQGGGFAGAAQGGGFASVTQGGGFAGPAQGGGFAAAAQGGGFATAAQGGGFGGAAPGGGFAVAASGGGGFSGAGAGGGFGGAAQGGSLGAGAFGAFSSNQGGVFSAFGGGAAKPPPELLNQMRK